MVEPLVIGQTSIEAGQIERLQLPISRLPTETWLSVPVEVIRGRRAGPSLLVCGGIHGDEMIGVEIIRRVRERVDPARLRGTLVTVPIVNVFGFINQSRYLPDRRDLNRSFPGSAEGSLAARLAHLFMTEVVLRCTHVIDLHSGSNHRCNLPQLRVNLRDPEVRRCALAFHPPVLLHAESRDGSLREAASKQGLCVLVYEGGEALRFDAGAIQLGVDGILRVMHALKMQKECPRKPRRPPIECHESRWVRARRSGILRPNIRLGELVAKRQTLGVISDAFGEVASTVRAPRAGIVVGQTNIPHVHQGDAVVHLAFPAEPQTATERDSAAS